MSSTEQEPDHHTAQAAPAAGEGWGVGSEPEEPRELPRAPLLSSTKRSLFSRQRKQAKMKGLKWKCKQESFPRQTVFPTPSEKRKPPCRAATNRAELGHLPPQRNREGLPQVPKPGGAAPATNGFSEPSRASSMKAKLPKGLTRVTPPAPVHLHGITKAPAARA